MKVVLDKIDIETCCIDDGIIWFLEQEKQWIVKYIITTGKTEVIDVLPEELKKKNSIGRILKKGSFIYFIPIFADDIYYYDLEDYTLKRLNIPFDRFEGMVARKIIEVIDGGEYIYCISRWPDFIIKIHHTTKEYEKIDIDEERREDKRSGRFIINFQVWIDDAGKICFPYCRDNVLQFEPRDNSFSEVEIPGIKNELKNRYLPRDGEKDLIRWTKCFKKFQIVCTFSGKVYKVEKESICSSDIWEHGVEVEERYKYLEDVVDTEDSLYFIPTYEPFILKQDIISGSIICIDNPMEVDYNKQAGGYHVIKKIDDKQIFLWSYSSHNAYILDTETDSIQKINFEVDLETFNGKGIQQIKYLMKDNMFMVDDLSVLLESLQKGIFDE